MGIPIELISIKQYKKQKDMTNIIYCLTGLIVYSGVYVSLVSKERASRYKSMVLGIIKILPISEIIKSLKKRNNGKKKRKKTRRFTQSKPSSENE